MPYLTTHCYNFLMLKVSVIIPVYNVEKYLTECLDSICGQTLRDIEIICVNDGSTDNSAEILVKYQNKDARIKIITQENKGPAGARNVGISAACGKYIYFMDSDDMLELDALDVLYKECQAENLDIIYFNPCVIYENSQIAKKHQWHQDFVIRGNYKKVVSGQELFVELKNNNEYLIAVWMQMIKKDFIQEISLAFPNGIYHEDILFCLKGLLLAKRVCVMNKNFFIRRIRVDSIMTKKKDSRHFYGYFVSYIKTLEFLALQEKEFELETVRLIKQEAEQYLHSAVSIYDLLLPTEKCKAREILAPTEQRYFETYIAHGRKIQRLLAWSLRKAKDIIRLCCKI